MWQWLQACFKSEVTHLHTYPDFPRNGLFHSSNPQRRYNQLDIRDILKNIPETPRLTITGPVEEPR